jgi:cytochrome c oxidase subunit 2
LSIASVVFSIVIVVLGYSLIFFRRRPGDNTDGPPIKGNSSLERAWTLIPLAIVIALSVYGAIVLDKMAAAGPPQTELEIDVLSFRYGWQFSYPQYGVTSYELYTPVNQRILVKLQSKDVVHSFWVEEWGPKQDAVPGITTQVRYTPTKIGKYTVQCSQLCGSGHTYMTAPVSVTSTSDFQIWVQKQHQPQATPLPTETSLPPPTTSPVAISTVPAVNLTLIADKMSFNTNTLTVPAGAPVTLTFDNQDSSVPHNFALYSDTSAATPIFVGQIITGPSSVVYKFTAPAAPGSYFFRCDVHPTTMTGTLVVK